MLCSKRFVDRVHGAPFSWLNLGKGLVGRGGRMYIQPFETFFMSPAISIIITIMMYLQHS